MTTHPRKKFAFAMALLGACMAHADMYLSDGHGGYCTDDGQPTAERPKCTKAQHNAFYAPQVGNPADQYIARKKKALVDRANWYLTQDGMTKPRCDRVISMVGGDLEQPVIAGIVCENAGERVLYEILNHAYGLDKHGHWRIATPEQIENDIHTMTAGMGLVGNWWSH